MTEENFWTVIEETHDTHLPFRVQNLFQRLLTISEDEIIAFDRVWTEHFFQLYTKRLWGAAHLAMGDCSEDEFINWRHWIISCGRRAFDPALNQPDELVPIIDSEPDAGCDGVIYAIRDALRAKNRAWENDTPEHEHLRHPKTATGPAWRSKDDLKLLLPKMYARYSNNPIVVVHKPAAALHLKVPAKIEPVVAPQELPLPVVETIEVPSPEKPWWKFWA